SDSATHLVFGRSWAKVRDVLRKIPTDTGSTWTGPTVSRWAMTASKIGLSRSGPVEKYSSRVIAGAHSWDCFVRPNWRPHSGQGQRGTPSASRTQPPRPHVGWNVLPARRSAMDGHRPMWRRDYADTLPLRHGPRRCGGRIGRRMRWRRKQGPLTTCRSAGRPAPRTSRHSASLADDAQHRPATGQH